MDSTTTNGDQVESEVERERRLRRESQRRCRSREDDEAREVRRHQDSDARRIARSLLSDEVSQENRRENTVTPVAPRITEFKSRSEYPVVGSHAYPQQFRDNKTFGPPVEQNLQKLWHQENYNTHGQALTGERIHGKCFVCGPNGTHYQPALPPYPHEWDSFINNRKTAGISRKLNNLFSLTALGVYDGDFMKFPDGISAVTLSGGRTYHRMLPAHEGQHAIRWFIHDPAAMFLKGAEMDILDSWINETLAGLQRVNPYVAELENLKSYNDNEDIALHLEHSDCISNEIAAIISLAPASPPSRRKLVIQRKGQAEPVFLDLLSPFVEPLH
ncbi:hypothetical protein K438DRAFT_1771788 [Mycena galopus ATCC 62051]|nr:hypothetical protein K438DRAFT_1771788 [Mycena galopus ATCC 62051]